MKRLCRLSRNRKNRGNRTLKTETSVLAGSEETSYVVAPSGVDVAHSGPLGPNVCISVGNPDVDSSKEVACPRYACGAKAYAVSNIIAHGIESV